MAVMTARFSKGCKLFIIGAVAGTLLDGLQTAGGQAYYADPFAFNTAWWVPLVFGFAVLLLAATHAGLHPFPAFRPLMFWGSLGFLVLACVVTAFAPFPSPVKAAILAGFYLISWGSFDRSAKSLWLALATALIGPAAESRLGTLELYHYTRPDLWGVPYWLPFLYLHVSAAAGHLGRIL